jgi:putative zinc finger/helix-turn-helix YgiT family protein
MNGFCPHCEVIRELRVVPTARHYDIRDETIEVSVGVLHCTHCANDFDPPTAASDPLDVAYTEFRRRRGMVQPEQIREARASFGLTQKELSTLLGWGGATLSRYENGALQDEAHDTALRLAMDPRNLLSLVETNPAAVMNEKLQGLLASLRRRILEDEGPMRRLYEQRFGSHEPDEYNGYRRLSIDKLFTSIMLFCGDPGIVKTKLNKLLFYADFKHFKDYSVSVTGARYAHLPYGPAPDGYSYFLATMQEDERTIATEESFINGHPAELLVATKIPDVALFAPSELKTLAHVKEHFQDASAKDLSELSHQERGYIETSGGQLISYEFAQDLGV